MLLTKLTIRNLKCYEAVVDIPFHRLTVFIGENDSGKTVLLDAVEFLLTNKNPTSVDYRKIGDSPAEEEIIISGVFELEQDDELPNEFRPLDGNEFTLTKKISPRSSKCEVLGRGFENPALNEFENQAADNQRDLLRQLGVETPASNKPGRIEQFNQLVREGGIPLATTQLDVSFNKIAEYLPRFQRISSADYKQPDSLIQSTLQETIDSFIRPKNEEGESVLLPELVDMQERMTHALNEKVKEMEDILRQINPKLRDLSVQTGVDFSKSVISRNLMIDLGLGYQLIESFGEGTKKKLWMGILDWIGRTQTQMAEMPYFRVYDEPDVNLDYSAERKLFANILETTAVENSRTQSVVCTHAVSLVDRAPAHSINLIQVSTDGARRIDFLQDSDDESVREFLATMGRTVGIANSALFYEKSFIVVEGESEENALPILYRNIYRRSMIEDGIVLVNLRTCGAWKSVLKILQTNKAHITSMLLDQDCNVPESTAFITPALLEEMGVSPDWQNTNCVYIGQKEFEDAFFTVDIMTVLNEFWQKADGTNWTEDDVDQFRAPDRKFADELLAHIRANCTPQLRSTMRKPVLAEKLAKHCARIEQIPERIQRTFTRAQEIANQA
jgi:predicted ATP-dependent endonuclease of OLD family